MQLFATFLPTLDMWEIAQNPKKGHFWTPDTPPKPHSRDPFLPPLRYLFSHFGYPETTFRVAIRDLEKWPKMTFLIKNDEKCHFGHFWVPGNASLNDPPLQNGQKCHFSSFWPFFGPLSNLPNDHFGHPKTRFGPPPKPHSRDPFWLPRDPLFGHFGVPKIRKNAISGYPKSAKMPFWPFLGPRERLPK
jgi:hypothetical protein